MATFSQSDSGAATADLNQTLEWATAVDECRRPGLRCKGWCGPSQTGNDGAGTVHWDVMGREGTKGSSSSNSSKKRERRWDAAIKQMPGQEPGRATLLIGRTGRPLA